LAHLYACRKICQVCANHPVAIRDLNETFLTLIPKVDRVCHVKEFRLIGL